MPEDFEPVVKTEKCAQYVDDNGNAAKNATDLAQNIRAVFQCNRQAGFKLRTESCHFKVRQVIFLCRTIASEVASPQTHQLNLFYKLLKAEVSVNITSELKHFFDSESKALSDACELALKQPFPGKQLVSMTDASFRSTGYALVIEDNPNQKIQSKRKTYAPVAFGSKSTPPRAKNVDILKRFLHDLHVFSRVWAHFLGSFKTDNCLNGH